MERLYKWTQNNHRNVNNPDYSDLLAQAVAKLQERRSLFK